MQETVKKNCKSAHETLLKSSLGVTFKNFAFEPTVLVANTTVNKCRGDKPNHLQKISLKNQSFMLTVGVYFISYSVKMLRLYICGQNAACVTIILLQ
jgi:hypothetical protein